MHQQSIEVKGSRHDLIAQGHVIVSLNDVTEVATLFDRATRGCLNNAVRVVAGLTRLDECQEYGLGEDQSEGTLGQVRQRSFGMEHQPVGQPGGLSQHVDR